MNIYKGKRKPEVRFGKVLSHRQCQVIDYLICGHSNEKIAWMMRLKRKTIQIHLKVIFKKFNVKTTRQLFSSIIHFIQG